MNLRIMKRFALAAAAALMLAASSGAGAPAGPLRVEGDSTLHKWTTVATAVATTFQFADGAPASLSEAIKASKLKGMEARISVAALKSGESGLDKNLRKAMNEEKYPDVVYRLEQYTLSKDAGDGVVTAKTSGQLTIAGQTKPVTIDVELRLGPDGVSVKGSYALKMSDYGIKPPTLMLGTIKVRDPVTIRFDLPLTSKEK